MKPNELMVGDWVCYNAPNKYYTNVEEIRCKDKGKIYYIRGYRDSKDPSSERLIFGDFSMDNLHPIPLTPEILEKNGFKKELNDDRIHFRFTLIESHTQFSLLYARSVFQWLGPLDFKYVHELQHVLRLCNIDKEIVL